MSRKSHGVRPPVTLDDMLMAAEAQHTETAHTFLARGPAVPPTEERQGPTFDVYWTVAGMRLECLKLAKDMHTDRSVESVAARAEKMYNYIVSGAVPEA